MEISIIQGRGLWPEKRINAQGSKSVLRISNWSKSVVIDKDPDFLACLPLGGVRALRSFHSLIQSSLIQEISGHLIAANLEPSVIDRVAVKVSLNACHNPKGVLDYPYPVQPYPRNLWSLNRRKFGTCQGSDEGLSQRLPQPQGSTRLPLSLKGTITPPYGRP